MGGHEEVILEWGGCVLFGMMINFWRWMVVMAAQQCEST